MTCLEVGEIGPWPYIAEKTEHPWEEAGRLVLLHQPSLQRQRRRQHHGRLPPLLRRRIVNLRSHPILYHYFIQIRKRKQYLFYAGLLLVRASPTTSMDGDVKMASTWGPASLSLTLL